MPRKTEQQKYESKKKQLNIGLANNAFGAAAGGIATGTAVGGAKKLWQASKGPESDPGHIYNQKKELPKFLGKGKGGAANKTWEWGRQLKKIPGPAKVAAGIGGAGLVGMQAVNAGMDAQSAAYFANEKRKLRPPAGMKPKEAVKKSDDLVTRFGVSDIYQSPTAMGTGIGFDISKATPRGNEREESRQKRVRRNEALGYLGAGAAGAGGAGLIGSTVPRGQKLSAGEYLRQMALKDVSPTKANTLKGAVKYRPRGKFFGGAALVAAAPAAAVLNRKAAERGKQTWE